MEDDQDPFQEFDWISETEDAEIQEIRADYNKLMWNQICFDPSDPIPIFEIGYAF